MKNLNSISFRRFVCGLLALVSAGFVFAEDWFVCFGSYRKAENAAELQGQLAEYDIPTFIYEYVAEDGTILNRVLYAEKSEGRDDARTKRNRLKTSEGVKQLGLTGLWICVAEWEEPAVEPEPEPEEEIIVPEPEEFEEEPEEEFDYEDESEDFDFEEEDEDFSYEEDEDEFEFEEEAAEEEPEEYPDYPLAFSVPLASCVALLPVSTELRLQAVELYNIDNINEYGREIKIGKQVDKYISGTSDVNAVAFAIYANDEKSVEIFITRAGQNYFSGVAKSLDTYLTKSDSAKQISLYGRQFKAIILNARNNISFRGVSDDAQFYVQLNAKGFTPREFEAFMNRSFSKSSVLSYPQLEKYLANIPEPNGRNRKFLKFTMDTIRESYLQTKDNADWSISMLDKWTSDMFFYEKESIISAELFDLEDADVAEETHDLFVEECSLENISNENHKEKLSRTDAWFVLNATTKELSFSQAEYIVTVNTNSENTANAADLRAFAEDLRIW